MGTAKWTWYEHTEDFSTPYGTNGQVWQGSYTINPPEALQRLIFSFGWSGAWSWNTTGNTSWWQKGHILVSFTLVDPTNGTETITKRFVGEAQNVSSNYYATTNRSIESVSVWIPYPIDGDIAIRRTSPQSPQPPIAIQWQVWWICNVPDGQPVGYTAPRAGRLWVKFLTSQQPVARVFEPPAT